MKMKKIIITAITLVISISLLSACSTAKNDKTKIALVTLMSHTSLDQIVNTIVAELGDEYDITIQNANGDTSVLSTIFQNIKTQNVDIVIPITTPAAQSAKTVFEGTSMPIVFAAVSDPLAAGLTGEEAANITGVSDNIPTAAIFELITHFQPNFQKIGFLYTSSETNSVSTVNAAKMFADENKISYEEASIANLSDLPAAVNTLIAKGVDALYTGTDNAIASAMPAYTDIAYSKKVAIYCGADSMVADGGFATIGVDYVQLGKQTADLVKKIANGTKPVDLPYEVLTEYAQFVNLQAADTLELTLSADMLEGFTILVEKDGTSHFGK